MVPDDTLTIRERAIASWPPAWHGQNQRDILVTLGYDVDRPWRELPKKDRDWILYTEETPTVPVYAGYTPAETRRALKRKEEPSYMGTFTGATAVRARDLRQDRERPDEEARLALHGEHRVPRVPRQAPPARGAQGQVRRPRHRRHVPPAAQAHGRDLRTVRGGDGARLPAAQGGASGEGDGRLPDRQGPRRPARGADGAGPRLPLARAQHADPLARRAPAPPARHPGPQQPLRRRLRARRALGGPASGGHRGAAPDDRPPQGRGQHHLRRRARARRHAPRRLDRGRRAGRGPARRRGALQRAGRGAPRGEGSRAPASTSSASAARRRASRGSPRAGSASRASPGTTCTTWRCPSRSACSPR